ncbi:diguanylate cyclase [Neptuniibacter sp. QD29_5]|uniref:diguanylate cyclase n=1 Tax=Neptuniibacter sp. QD29_5 TaxID=3398207 RepID=UPI0039F51617
MQKLTLRFCLPWLVGLIVTAFAFFTSGWLVKLDHNIHDRQDKAQVEARINYFSSRIQMALSDNLIIIEALESLLLLKNNIDESEFQILATRFLSTRATIRQAQLAPDAIIQHIYPVIDGSKVIGLDLRKIPEQKNIVERSIESKEMIMAGPLDLIQGGRGVIARQPLYNREGIDTQFWGFITLIIDLDKILQETGLILSDDLATYAIRGSDAKGKQGKVFFGSPSVFEDEYLSSFIEVPGGFWQLSAQLKIDNHVHGIPASYLTGWAALGSLILGLLSGFTCSLLNKTYQRSITDPLTSLFNRQHFREITEIEIQRAQRYQLPLSIIMIDLDFFKQINDNHGHQAGDYVLKKSARLIQSMLRVGDIAARYGGEEFIILLPHSDEVSTQACAERIRKVLNAKINLRGAYHTLSASLGCVTLDSSYTNYDQLVSGADEALFLAKDRGRNRVVTTKQLEP